MASISTEQNLFDQLSQLDAPDDHEEKRYFPRSRLVRTGELEVDGKQFPCFIVDLSRKGTKIRTLEPLEMALSAVRLHMSDIGVFDADVRWVRETEIGLLLKDEIAAPEDYETATIQEVLRLQNET